MAPRSTLHRHWWLSWGHDGWTRWWRCHRIRLRWCQKLRLHDKGGKSDLQCPQIHLECSQLGCPQFSHHERHLGRIGQSTGPLSHAGRGHALLFPKGFGIKADQSHSTCKALWTSFRSDKRVINTNSKSSYRYGYETIGEEVDLLLDL